jgi:hypothetical protein
VFFTLKVRSPVCRGPMRSSSPPVSFDMCTRDDAEAFVRNRARNVLASVDNMPWKPGGCVAAL